MSELTYILGAGASYQSFPIVNTFNKRFNDFIKEYDSLCVSAKEQEFEFYKELLIGAEFAKKLSSEFDNHQSFDTYFKKLFHQQKNKEIKLAKKIMQLYFLWEHLKPDFVPDNSDKSIFHKQSKIDKRYDALIAGLLKPINILEPYCKINFISWNYDLSLISSIKNFFSPSTNWNQYLSSVKKDSGVWNIEGKIEVFNMNGFFQSGFLNDGLLDFTENFYSILKKKVHSNYFDDSSSDTDSEFIKFAWENPNMKMEKLIKSRISNSNNIVVIGYTFPLYNRIVDLQYLDATIFDYNKIVLQDPNAENLRTTFLEMFGFNDNIGKFSMLNTKKDCEYFYVPSNIFGK
jgi:hypothetical protein